MEFSHRTHGKPYAFEQRRLMPSIGRPCGESSLQQNVSSVKEGMGSDMRNRIILWPAQ